MFAREYTTITSMLNHPAANEVLNLLRAAEADAIQQRVAAGLTLDGIRNMQPEELDLDGRESLERTAVRVMGLKVCPECSISWVKRFMTDVQDSATRLQLERLINLVEECAEQLKIRPQDKVLASKVLDVAQGFSWFHRDGSRVPSVSDPAASIPMSKRAMVAKYKNIWPSIEKSDMKSAAENGLAAAAKVGERGWDEKRALRWAEAKGKIIKPSEEFQALTGGMNQMASLPGRKHVLKG